MLQNCNFLKSISPLNMIISILFVHGTGYGSDSFCWSVESKCKALGCFFRRKAKLFTVEQGWQQVHELCCEDCIHNGKFFYEIYEYTASFFQELIYDLSMDLQYLLPFNGISRGQVNNISLLWWKTQVYVVPAFTIKVKVFFVDDDCLIDLVGSRVLGS